MGLSLHSAAVTGLLFGAALWLAVMARHRRRAAQHLGHLPADPLKTLLQRGAADDENIIASRREQLQQRGGNMAEDPLDAVTLYRMTELFGSEKPMRTSVLPLRGRQYRIKAEQASCLPRA